MGASRVVIVIPSIVPDMTTACLASISSEIIDPTERPTPLTRLRDVCVKIANGCLWHDGKPDVRLVVVWNTPEHNYGVGQSWEVGRRELLRTGADWLWIVSAAVRFGPEGGQDFLNVLEYARGDALAVEADNGMGFHCIAFRREVLETVGPFDPIWFPAYHEDNDLSWRIQCAYRLGPADYPLWPKVEIDAHLTEVAHGIKHGGVTVDLAGLAELYVRKWGGVSGSERWCHPYDDDALDFTFTGPYPT